MNAGNLPNTWWWPPVLMALLECSLAAYCVTSLIADVRQRRYGMAGWGALGAITMVIFLFATLAAMGVAGSF